MVSASSPPPLLQPPLPHSVFSAKLSAVSPPSFRLRQPRISASCAASAERTRSTCFLTAAKLDVSRNSLYQVLGIPIGASGHEIKAAYRRLARVCHPDVDRRDSSADEFMKLRDAYSTLSDPEKRADYDRRLLPPRRPVRSYSGISASPATARFSGYVRRNWETDQCW